MSTRRGDEVPPPGIDVTIDGPLARLVVRNPARRNALTRAMLHDLPRRLAELDRDPAVALISISGYGDTFCSGADLSSWDELAATGRPAELMTTLQLAFEATATPTIAVVEGFALGGGCQLAVGADFRYAVSGASFGVPASKAGIVYTTDGLRALREVVGPVQTKRLLYGGDPIPAAEAAWIGLVDLVAPREEIELLIVHLAQRYADRSATTIAATKLMLTALSHGDPARDVELSWTARADEIGETREGVAAFQARRVPRFPSRG